MRFGQGQLFLDGAVVGGCRGPYSRGIDRRDAHLRPPQPKTARKLATAVWPSGVNSAASSSRAARPAVIQPNRTRGLAKPSRAAALIRRIIPCSKVIYRPEQRGQPRQPPCRLEQAQLDQLRRRPVWIAQQAIDRF